MYSSTLFFNLGGRWMGWLTPRFGHFSPWKETRYPFYRRLDGPWDRSRRVRKISSPPGFGPRSVEPSANRYTDLAAFYLKWKPN